MFLLLAFPACRRVSPLAPSDVVPVVSLAPDTVVAGQPVAVSYAFEVGPQYQALPVGWRAFVHFVAGDGTVLIDDDHEPQPPPSQWRPGRRYEYARLVFTHRQFPGRLEVVMGLFDPSGGARLRMRADHLGRGEHRVATLNVARDTNGRSAALYRRGFYGPASWATRPFVAQRWMSRAGVLSFRNPRADGVLFLTASTRRDAFDADPRLEVRVGRKRVDRTITDDRLFVVAARLGPDDLGGGEWCDVSLSMDREFRPEPPDTRRLSLSVENAVLLPAAQLDPALLAIALDHASH